MSSSILIASRRKKARIRCGTCEACMRPDCGGCSQCVQKRKFGGNGTSKQACIHRRCSDLRDRMESAGEEGHIEKMGQYEGETCVTAGTATGIVTTICGGGGLKFGVGSKEPSHFKEVDGGSSLKNSRGVEILGSIGDTSAFTNFGMISSRINKHYHNPTSNNNHQYQILSKIKPLSKLLLDPEEIVQSMNCADYEPLDQIPYGKKKNCSKYLYGIKILPKVKEVCAGCNGNRNQEAKDEPILLCDGPGCSNEYHLSCCIPPLMNIPEGLYYCFDCNPKGATSSLEAYFESHDENRSDHGCSQDYHELLLKQDIEENDALAESNNNNQTSSKTCDKSYMQQIPKSELCRIQELQYFATKQNTKMGAAKTLPSCTSSDSLIHRENHVVDKVTSSNTATTNNIDRTTTGVKRNREENTGASTYEEQNQARDEGYKKKEIEQSLKPPIQYELSLKECKQVLSQEQIQSRAEERPRDFQQQIELFSCVHPSFFVGKPLRMHCPLDNLYHCGRVVDYRRALQETQEPRSRLSSFVSLPTTSAFEFLIRFPAGKDYRKETLYHWVRLEEHSLAVGTHLVWAKYKIFQPAMVMLRTARELIPVRHMLQEATGEIIYPIKDSSLKGTKAEAKIGTPTKKSSLASSMPPLWALAKRFGEEEDGFKLVYVKNEVVNLLSLIPPLNYARNKTLYALAIAEYYEQQRVRKWRSLRLYQPRSSKNLRSLDEYALEPLGQKKKDVTLCPLVPQGLDRAYILNNLVQCGVVKTPSKDVAVSLNCYISQYP